MQSEILQKLWEIGTDIWELKKLINESQTETQCKIRCDKALAKADKIIAELRIKVQNGKEDDYKF